MFKITNRKSCVACPPRRQALHGNRQQSCSARSTECRGSRAAMPWLVIILFNPQCSTRTYLLVGWQSHFAVGRYILSDFLYSTDGRAIKLTHRTNYPRHGNRANGQRSCFARSTECRAFYLPHRTNSPRHGNRANGKFGGCYFKTGVL